MRVYDIFAEASEYLGTNDETHVFRTCTRAAEYLAAKGDWDILKGYVDLPIQENNLVVLPWQVDTPLKFNINNNPAFSKDRLYEFTLNGFGSTSGPDRTEFSWEDRGFVPYSILPPRSGFKVAIAPSTVDAGKKILLQGLMSNSVEGTETLTITQGQWFISTNHYQKLTEVNKDVTTNAVNLFYIAPPPPNDNFGSARLLVGANYNPNNVVSGTTINATVEAAEPSHATVINTVWYKWVGVTDGLITNFWTNKNQIIEVFTGTGLHILVLIATSDNTSGRSLVEFTQQAGVTYRIRVRPQDATTIGDFSIAWYSLTDPLAPGDFPDVPVVPEGSDIPENGSDGPDIPLPLPPVTDPPTGTTLIANYKAQETNPRYRLIRLSQTGYNARFLFRRKIFKITSMDDFIPIQSELGFLTMVQAIQGLRRKDLETAKALADAAVEITTDAQRATTGFIELANQTEVQEARNYQIYNRDSVIVLDIFDDFAKFLGNVGENVIFDAITTALEVLCAKGHYDGLTGYVDIQTDGWRYATLPRFVDQPVMIAINGRPAYMRNKWSEFHLNGPGSDEYGGQYMGGSFGSWYGGSGSGRWGQIHAWDSVGQVVTIKPLGAVSQLVAIPDSATDNGKTMRIFGYDETGKRIVDANGNDGFTITVNQSKIKPDILLDQKVARIDRITRQETNNFVRLIALDAAQQTESVLLGYYYPDETEPQYFRIKLPADAAWIRMRYRKRTYKVTSVWQPLHLYSRMAIITMGRSINTIEKDAAAAQVLQDLAVKFLDDDQKARNPGEIFQLQFNEDAGWGSNFILQ